METETFEQIKKEIKTTYFSRYAAARRISRLNMLSLIALTTSSLSLILTTIIIKYIENENLDGNLLEFFQISGAIMILFLSLTITFSDLSLKSERMRNSADKINGIYKKLRVIDLKKKGSEIESIESIEKIYQNYHEIVVGDNHSYIDYINGRTERKKQENTLDEKKIFSFKHLPESSLIFVTFIFSLITVIILVLSLC